MAATNTMFWPVIAHAFLVLLIYMLLGWRRRAAVMGGDANVAQFRENRDEPALSLYARNNLANQFELPVLFYTVCVLISMTDADNAVTVTLAWLFVASRYAHSFEHVTRNRVPYRSAFFAAGFLCLGLMWGWLVVWLTIN